MDRYLHYLRTTQYGFAAAEDAAAADKKIAPEASVHLMKCARAFREEPRSVERKGFGSAGFSKRSRFGSF